MTDMHWYVLSETTGVATLCASETDARREAGAYDRLYPRAAPHFATRLVALDGSAGRACPKCGAQILDPFGMGKAVHDVGKCAGALTPNT